MLSEKLVNELNEQIKFEMYSSNLYLSMAAFCFSNDLDGFGNFFVVQAEEEKFHAMKFFNFLNDMDGDIIMKAIDDPSSEYSSILDVFNAALQHERGVTARIYHLMDVAMEEREHATISFLKWFIDEQVEEESTFKTLVTKIKRAANDDNLLYTLDSELATRTFTPPAQ